MREVAKLFKNGSSQAVRLPAAFRFEGDEVFIRRNSETGEVILSSKPTTWDGFFELLSQVPVPADFLGAAERLQQDTGRDPFEDWRE